MDLPMWFRFDVTFRLVVLQPQPYKGLSAINIENSVFLSEALLQVTFLSAPPHVMLQEATNACE